MGKLDDAAEFLHEGLRENPGSPQLLFDLGRLYFESRHDPVHARNVWEAALRNLGKLRDKDRGSDENIYAQEQILGQLARLEEQTNHPEKAIQWLEQLKGMSPSPDEIQKWIDRVKQQSAEEFKSVK
jgi:tetratricopeptide (TPR) repeat protein